ncbi:MAG: 50S ribosome-binding GTPase [Anaerolineales bacterium]|nr:50S ribosome-binding GTPase [Anaerolineales bacterium]
MTLETPPGAPVIALAGNPNAGKSTLFNALTGLHQHTGNWPGKTVEKREGLFKRGSVTLRIIDLPGAYSLSAFTPEEIITRDFILNAAPSAVVNVLDATNLERNLYFTVQLLELGVPVLLALNMVDELPGQGLRVDVKGLAQQLGVPVVALSARSGDGLDGFVTELLKLAALPAGGQA